MQSYAESISFLPKGVPYSAFKYGTANFVTQTIDDTIFCCLGFKVYNDNNKLIQTANVRITGHDGSKPTFGISFPDADEVQARRYERGVPVLGNTKIYLHEDKSFTVVGSKTIFAPVWDLDYKFVGFWVFRLNNLNVREFLPVDDILTWLNKLEAKQDNFENLRIHPKTRGLIVSVATKTVHVTDLLAYSDFIATARSANFSWADNKLRFSAEPAPSEVYYLPNMLCDFDLTLSPSVGARYIIAGGTPSSGHLNVNSDLDQNRGITLQGTQAHLNCHSGILNITADESSRPSLEIQSPKKAVLNIEGSLRSLCLKDVPEGSVTIKQDVDMMTLNNTAIYPVVGGSVGKLSVINSHIEKDYELAGTKSLYMSNVEFNGGSLTLKKLPELVHGLYGHSCLFISGGGFEDFVCKVNSFKPSNTWKVQLDLTSRYKYEGECIYLDLIFEDVPELFMREGFRTFMRDFRLITRNPVHLRIVNTVAGSYDDYVKVAAAGMREYLRDEETFERCVNKSLVYDSRAHYLAREPFNNVMNNPLIKAVSFVKMKKMKHILDEYGLTEDDYVKTYY